MTPKRLAYLPLLLVVIGLPWRLIWFRLRVSMAFERQRRWQTPQCGTCPISAPGLQVSSLDWHRQSSM